MNETIGVKGGKNDRKRMLRLKRKKKQKLAELQQDKELKELEKEVKRKQTYTLVRTLPIIIVGGTVKAFYDGVTAKKEPDKEVVDSQLPISDYDVLPPKNDTQVKVITTKEGTRVRVNIPKKSTSILDLIIVKDVFTEKKEEYNPEPVVVSGQKNDDVLPLTKKQQEKLHDLKSKRLVEEYEKELKNIRYDLRQLVFEYNALVDQEEDLVLSDEVQEVIDKLSEVIRKIEVLKNKIKIEDLDKYDANYIYTLIEGYLQEFRSGKAVGELKDSPLYVLIAEKLNELDKEKDKLNKKLDAKKEKFKEREEKFDKLKEQYYDVDKINNDIRNFQIEQEKLLAEIREKIAKSMDVSERVEVQFQAMNSMSRRLLRLLALQMFIPGARNVKAITTSTAAYLHFVRNVLNPKTTTRTIKVITVKDYSSEIERNIKAIDDASRLLGKTSKQIDKMIDEIKDNFKDYIGVIKECDELLSNLEKIKSNLREKEYEMQLIKEQQEKQLELNNAKVLKRGEFPM